MLVHAALRRPTVCLQLSFTQPFPCHSQTSGKRVPGRSITTPVRSPIDISEKLPLAHLEDQVPRIALLMDGDQVSKSHASAIIAAVKEQGELVDARWFGVPDDEKHRESMAAQGVGLVLAPRLVGGTLDLQDVLISMHAARAISTGKADTVALATGRDHDFVAVSKQLHEWGGKTMLLVHRANDDHNKVCWLSRNFASVGTEIVPYSTRKPSASSKMQAVLQADGRSTMVPTQEEDWQQWQWQDDTQVRTLLFSLGYLQEPGEPLPPSIAKFYHVNEIGSLTVWPAWYSLKSAIELISQQQGRLWKRDPGNLIFVDPRAQLAGGKTNRMEERKYGTRICAEMALAGGPRIFNADDELVTRFLEALGYLDTDMNCDMGEAIMTFSAVAANRKKIAKLGVQIEGSMATCEKVAAVRRALIESPKNAKTLGGWTTAGSDKHRLDTLMRLNIISDANASSQTVLVEMQTHLEKIGVKPYTTPRAVMRQIMTHINAHNPQKRK